MALDFLGRVDEDIGMDPAWAEVGHGFKASMKGSWAYLMTIKSRSLSASASPRAAEIRSFENLIVWQKAHQLFLDVVRDVERFPNGGASGVIVKQLRRSSSSISANIAAGFGRRMGREYTHYLIVARGSTTETMDWYLKCRDLGLVGPEIFQERKSQLDEVLKMLNKMVSQQLDRR